MSRKVVKNFDSKVENEAEVRLLRNLRGVILLIRALSVSSFGASGQQLHFQLDTQWCSGSPPSPKANSEVASDLSELRLAGSENRIGDPKITFC